MAEELKKLTSRVQGVKGGKGIEGLNYEDMCIHPDIELSEGYKPPKFDMFDGTGDPKVHLRTYCDKLVGVGKDERIRMKLFMRSLTGDALSWFSTENAPDVFYIQNLKKKPTETFRGYATRWRSEAAKPPVEVEVAAPTPFEVETTPAAAPAPFEVEVTTPFTMTVESTPPFKSKVAPWDYAAQARRKGKAKMEESGAAQGMTRTCRIYTPENLGGMIREAASKQPIIETRLYDLWKKLQAREYYVVDHLNKTHAQISILSLLQNSEAHRNALMKVFNEAYVPNNITSGDANMVGQVLENHKITFHEDELPPEGLSHNRTLDITVQCEDKFIARVLIDGGSSFNICPLTTLKRLGKGLHEIRAGTMDVKAFDGSQKATIRETNLCMQMGPTWFDVEFQVLDISASHNLLLGRPWIHVTGAVASTLHQAIKFEWNHQEVIIHGDGSNPIYTNQTAPVMENRRKLGGETYRRIEHDNAIEKDKWWSSKIESILVWGGYKPSKGLGKNLQVITKSIHLKITARPLDLDISTLGRSMTIGRRHGVVLITLLSSRYHI
ncbi:uncharacterized protein [Nicotiana tomentosiformis]|uniref:uncharacterized protein n=1 Tax=Nicotiana tomentosiformis TaxID=4098 RepID=UPI00388CAF3B